MSLLKGTSQRRGFEILTGSSAMKNILRVNHSWTARIDSTTPVAREINQLPLLEEVRSGLDRPPCRRSPPAVTAP